MKVKALLTNTRKSLKKCSKLLTQLQHNPTFQVSNALTRELKLGESLEHELFQLCEKEGVSPNQLRLLGHQTTFSQWRRNNNMQRHEPSHSHTDTSQESPTLTVSPSPPPPPPPVSPHIPPTPPDMSDPHPWLQPIHLRRLLVTRNSSPYNQSITSHSE